MTLRAMPGVEWVTQPCWMNRETFVSDSSGLTEGFRIQWFADATLTNGLAISFTEDLSWHDNEWQLEAGVRIRTYDDEQDELLMAPTEPLADTELVPRLLARAAWLEEHHEQCVARFLAMVR